MTHLVRHPNAQPYFVVSQKSETMSINWGYISTKQIRQTNFELRLVLHGFMPGVKAYILSVINGAMGFSKKFNLCGKFVC